MINIKIDKGVPLPPPHRSHRIYPWNEMAVGDSFFIPDTKNYSAAYQAKKLGFKVTTRRENGGVRIWRIA